MHQKAARAAADQQCRAGSLRKSGWPLRLLRSFSSILIQPDGWMRQFIVLAHAWASNHTYNFQQTSHGNRVVAQRTLKGHPSSPMGHRRGCVRDHLHTSYHSTIVTSRAATGNFMEAGGQILAAQGAHG